MRQGPGVKSAIFVLRLVRDSHIFTSGANFRCSSVRCNLSTGARRASQFAVRSFGIAQISDEGVETL